ncbi:rhomboid family intramembrane serine protease, partial [bacterium AH-315-G11]|nr:rhomboid family intramembrane serine protease [bacterium AH-315-G11]
MNWKKPPVITILLVVVNTLLFSFWQVNDEKLAYDASQYYMASSLPKIELPKYEAFLRQQNRLEEANEMVHMQQGHAARVMLWQLQHDASFLQLIQDKNLLKADDPKRSLWLKERRIFDAKFNDITTESHAFKPAFPEISDAFSHMFMHGSIMHLIGNMVFLLIVGLVVERLLGSPLYLLVYLVGGLAALAFFTLGNLNSAVPLLGASGAIAALMGLYAALFGARKIPFFYSIGFYFDCIR